MIKSQKTIYLLFIILLIWKNIIGSAHSYSDLKNDLWYIAMIEHNSYVNLCDFIVEPYHRLGIIRQSKIFDMLTLKGRMSWAKY